MLKSLANYFMRNAVEKHNSNRKKQFLNWDKIEKIALIIDNTHPVNKSEIDKFTDSTKKYVDVFFIELNSKQASYSDWICFTSKDKTFLNLPKSHIDLTIKNRQYQLAITVSEKHSLFAAVVISKINAPYTCGNRNLSGEIDLIIERNEKTDLPSYLREVLKYLTMIRIN
ncbi:MAG: hypothetical protein H0W61_12300 [Bacteroidetes bacterium]|nr:hypothetical protein [Bacteroidota bacterium]